MEKTAESPIIADTSALVSLATDTDHNHIPAKEPYSDTYPVSIDLSAVDQLYPGCFRRCEK